jgi:hypothetical protein
MHQVAVIPRKRLSLLSSREVLKTSVNTSASAFAGGNIFVGCSIIRAVSLPFRNL